MTGPHSGSTHRRNTPISTSTGSRPYRRPGGLSDKDLKALVDDGVAKNEPEALLLLARLSRRGALYPQDDEAATKHLISAANLGSVEAMVLLGEAYDDGLGIDKNPRERLRAWREAARRGSLEAKAKLARAFIFDFSDRLLTLREGVTGRIALYIDGVGAAPAPRSVRSLPACFPGPGLPTPERRRWPRR